MMKVGYSIRCAFGQKDCFAYGGYCDGCVALVEKPDGKTCPFYKPREQIEQEQANTVKRLTCNDRTDLLEQYGEISTTPIQREEVKR